MSFELDGGSHRASIHATDGPSPGILLVHTAMGLTMHDRAIALRLHQEGVACMLVRYSGRTTGSLINDDHACHRIDRILAAAWDRLRSDPGVDAERVSIFGLSLGGYFAMRLAARNAGPPPTAVVVWYGMYHLALSMVVDLRSPLLIVQGTRDAQSFVDAARAAAGLARDRVELLLYQGTPHQFDLFQSRSSAAREAWLRTVAFLKGGPRAETR